MSTSAPITADEFQALEHKVLRAVEIVKRERDARASAEAEIAQLQQKLAEQAAELEQHKADHATTLQAHADELNQHTSSTQAQIEALHQERTEVRQRVEKMLQQMDDLL